MSWGPAWLALALAAALLLAPPALAEEPPALQADVDAGRLPPLAQRLPRTPLTSLNIGWFLASLKSP